MNMFVQPEVAQIINLATRYGLSGTEIYQFAKTSAPKSVTDLMWEFIYFPDTASKFGFSEESIENLGFYRDSECHQLLG